MKSRNLLYIFLFVLSLSACSTNNLPNLPHIALDFFVPDSMHVNVDTCFIQFDLTCGSAAIGNSATSQIWLKDNRYDTGFFPVAFPTIDPSIEDPTKGLMGTCLFFPIPQPTPRTDSNHLVNGDTMYYEMYITDRSGNQSNHITTHTLIIRP